MKAEWLKLEPTGKPDPKKIDQYLEAYRKGLPEMRRDKFQVKAEWTGTGFKIGGAAEREDWNRVVDLVGMLGVISH